MSSEWKETAVVTVGVVLVFNQTSVSWITGNSDHIITGFLVVLQFSAWSKKLASYTRTWVIAE